MTETTQKNLFIRILSGFWTFLDKGWHAGLNILFLLFLIALISSIFSKKEVEVPKGAALILNPQGMIVEQKDFIDPMQKAINQASGNNGPAQTSLADILFVLENAAKDKRINGLIIDTSNMMGAGMTKLQAIGEALEKFKTSGKPVYARAAFYGQPQYYLASYADEISIDPMGAVMLEGFGRFRTYFKSFLDLIGVNYHIFKVGTFKSAVEPYLYDAMSDQAKEANQMWLNVLWDAYKSDVAKARRLTAQDIENYTINYPQSIQDAMGDNAKVALEAKLVTTLQNDIEFQAEMVEKFGSSNHGKDDDKNDFKQVSMLDYIQAIRPPIELPGNNENRIALITAKGEILDGEQPEGKIGGRTLAKLIERARLDEKVKAIVLRVDSPGGSAFASEIIRRELLAAKAAGKKLVVSMGTYAASGGYWISADADQIWARPTTITGSIGIFGMFPTFEKPLNKYGIHRDCVGTTPMAGAFNVTSALKPEFGEIIQQIINHGYDNFLTIVSKGRNMTKEDVNKIAQGRVWSGKDALERGLVDKLGSLQDAIDAAADLANISNNFDLVKIRKELTPEQKLVKELLEKSQIKSLIQSQVSSNANFIEQIKTKMSHELQRLASFNDPQGLYVDCLCILEP